MIDRILTYIEKWHCNVEICDYKEIESKDHREVIVDIKRKFKDISMLKMYFLKRELVIDLKDSYIVDRYKIVLLKEIQDKLFENLPTALDIRNNAIDKSEVNVLDNLCIKSIR